MEYIIVAFRSRAQTLKFAESMKNKNLNVEIVNTPKEAGIGCGLSVKIPQGYFELIKRMPLYYNYSSFAGFFKVTQRKDGRMVRSI